MFWRFGGYANISTIDTILDKPDFTLEELLEEADLIQELKQHNSKLIEFLREDKVLEKLLEYTVAPKLEAVESAEEPADDDIKTKGRLLPFSRPRASSRATDPGENDDELDKKRNRYAHLIRDFWNFLSRPAPLDPLQASYFTKVNESLFEKKTEEMMELLWSLPNVIPDMLRHVECPMVMDLLLKIIALDRTEGGQGVVEWLYSKDIIPTLISFLGPEHSWVVQTAASDFIKAIITISANASQNEQQCIGPNELTRQLVSKPCVEQLVGYMLGGGNPLTVGVGIIIEVIRKNNSDYDPDVGTEANTTPSSRDPIYLGNLLRLFAQNVPKFMNLIMNEPSKKQGVDSTFNEKLEPLGFDRFKTCELMAELLHCSNMGLLNEIGSEQLIATRDFERQRLRAEGKLTPRDDDGSADDLTMRIPHPSHHEEVRRLEVTNADDDGFEEVEPTNELNEDTSHEFVKAEDDIAPGANASSSSFLEKDEEEFVDEPLSSPRLAVATAGLNEQRFEVPDLVVAPLSPTKAKSPELAKTEVANPPAAENQSKAIAGEQKPETVATVLSGPIVVETAGAGNTVASEQSETDSSSQSETTKPGLQPSPLPKDEVKKSEPVTSTPQEAPVTVAELVPEEIEKSRGLSPHPEDTPPPLFSVPLAPDSGVQEPPQSFTPPPGTEPALAEAAASEKPAETAAGDATEAVVGDFLKMQFVEYRVVPAILSFFFAYPWNNFLHNVVYDIVQQVFNGPMDRGFNPTLAVSLFEAADITSAIIKGQQASDESQARTKTRMGYMGHLTLIAEEVVKFTERHPPELLSEMVLDKVMSQDWINYVEGALAETRERDNAILGGVRPEVALGHRASLGASGLGGIGLSGLANTASGSNALAEAGLNGGMEMNEGDGNGIGPFAISAGTLMSGFGSSSDEDDDEGDGDEEDVNSEFRSYTDPLNQGSLAPPSIPPPPPPPPPLNIPPSRARLQLAARLAMHQKNNQAAQATSATVHDDNDDDDDDNLEDPFGDGEADIDDDLDDEMSGNIGRGSWWRGVVNRRSGLEEEDSDDDEEEFGDFAMPEEDKGGDGQDQDNVVLKPLAVHPPRESSRGLSGLWPFGSRAEKEKSDGKDEQKGDDDARMAGEGDEEPEKRAIEVKEAQRRTSIEDDDDDDETNVGTEYGADFKA
ncbi:SIT4 phosphatase-associated protein domain-containing protein [Trichoderma breve]|uniref:SIT4 phosphatase-associated protein domain-containing protein n=1 Tax=Trichoderma breve TaxID=2034170 RepID=A0A9W9E6S6_9HYPO|nr:SIT4 phosphatase-associated protein domain-containing protein [Trichoderma breve]KAJ4859580.1 SIT4 phosphatase-associated protein domain-containing protein [Trichoderma breve]